MQYAQRLIEWARTDLANEFDTTRKNVFNFRYALPHHPRFVVADACASPRHIKMLHAPSQLKSLPSPMVVLASGESLTCGFAKDLFCEWARDPKNTVGCWTCLTTKPH